MIKLNKFTIAKEEKNNFANNYFEKTTYSFV